MWILVLFGAHWVLSAFAQSSFHHRYASHRMFTMSKRMERVFHLFTYVAQGSSYLSPRAYAIMHREHHAFSDTERDPHAPGFFRNVFTMMWATAVKYSAHLKYRSNPEARFLGDYPEWPTLERIADAWTGRVAWGAGYTLFYIGFATAWWQFLLLPAHYIMGPIHGAIVNWCGHRYGYRNFGTRDQSRNFLPIDLVTLGELYQNNHHHASGRINFAFRKFELDPTYLVLRGLAKLRMIQFNPGALGAAA